MIFNSNTTSLAASNIPMAEGYDCSYGAALALVEGARNDYKMFRAMLDIDARELQIRRENANIAVQESELAALNEAALSGIWNKIKELFSKLIAKIKAILHTFMSKINSLFMKDRDMVKKYEKEILRKSNIGNLEVKWRKKKDIEFAQPIDGLTKESVISKIIDNKEELVKAWKEEASERLDYFANELEDISSADDFENEVIEKYLDDEETLQIKEIDGGARGILNFLTDYSKAKSALEKSIRNATNGASKAVDAANKIANETANTYKSKALKNAPDNAVKDADTKISNANKVYDMAVAYQTMISKEISAYQFVTKEIYKYTKAAFMKMIAANDKKLEENAIYLDAVAEAAEEEVEDVINGAINSVDVTNTNNASTNVLDPSVSNDPDALVYGDDPDYEEAKTDGRISTNYVSKEAAFFAQPLY